MQRKIEIVEVGPRDGFQNVSALIETEMKLNIIDRIADSGVKSIQITSFVHPKAIPQMWDSKEVTKYCLEKYPDLNLSALVPNIKGAEKAIELGHKEISYVISISETHNMKNVKKTPKQSLIELKKLIDNYPEVKVNLDLATTFGCPFEGIYSYETVLEFIDNAYKIGVRSFNLCDTIGIATPSRVKELVSKALQQFQDCEFQIHIHDTRNMGIVNSLAAIECGINKVQTSVGGLGGCPFAPGASGNTSTEDLVYMLNQMEYETDISFEKILEAAKYVNSHIDGNYSGHHIFIDETKVQVQV